MEIRDDKNIGDALRLYLKLFRNPAAMVFLLLFFLVYTVVSSALVSNASISFLEIATAAPFAVSAFVLGTFSVLFWALNYVGRSQKSELRCQEAERLFQIRRNEINEIFSEAKLAETPELAVLKAHLLISGKEIDWEPETPAPNLGFDYSEAVKAVIRKS